MRRPFPLPLLALATACATGGASAGGAPPQQASPTPDAVQTQRPIGAGVPGVSGTTLRTVTEDFVKTGVLAAPPDRAWSALTAAYADLELPVTLRVDDQRRIGSQGQRFRGAIGGTRLGLLFSCGASAGGGDAADGYEVTIDLTSTVAPDPDGAGSVVRSLASAFARPVSTSGEPVRCVSTGRLERKVAEAAAKRLGG